MRNGTQPRVTALPQALAVVTPYSVHRIDERGTRRELLVRELIQRKLTVAIRLKAGFIPRAGIVWADGQGLMSSDDYLDALRKSQSAQVNAAKRKSTASDGGDGGDRLSAVVQNSLTPETAADIRAAVDLGVDKARPPPIAAVAYDSLPPPCPPPCYRRAPPRRPRPWHRQAASRRATQRMCGCACARARRSQNLIYPRCNYRLVLSADGSELIGVFDRPEDNESKQAASVSGKRTMCFPMRLLRVL